MAGAPGLGWPAATGVVQLVGSEITVARLEQALPEGGVLFTYNGHCFDLVCIRRQLGIDLRARFAAANPASKETEATA